MRHEKLLERWSLSDTYGLSSSNRTGVDPGFLKLLRSSAAEAHRSSQHQGSKGSGGRITIALWPPRRPMKSLLTPVWSPVDHGLQSQGELCHPAVSPGKWSVLVFR